MQTAALLLAVVLGVDNALASPTISRHSRPSVPRSNPHYEVFRNHPIAPMLAPGAFKTAHFAVAGPNAAAFAAPESVRGGAFLASSDIRHVTATILVPEARIPTEGPTAGLESQTFMASFWVGIDGVTCTGSAIRTGIDIFWDGALGGEQNYYTWHNWHPNPSQNFGNFEITAGNLLRLNVTATSTTSGFVTVENLETKQVVRQEFNNQSDALCLKDAAWIVEDFPLGSIDLPTPFVNFTTTAFSAARAEKGTGKSVCTTNATVFNIHLQDQGGQLTDCSIANASSVSCSRIVGAPNTLRL